MEDKMTVAWNQQHLTRLLDRCIEDEHGCWVWTGYRNSDGYGKVYKATYGEELLHRFTYRQIVGEIPRGLVLDHLCKNPPCCNPYHLRPVPQRVNMLAGEHHSAVAHRTGVCKRGHELSNEYWDSHRERWQCNTCRRVRRISSNEKGRVHA